MLTRFRLSAITDTFRQMTGRLRSARVYVSPMKKKTLPTLTVYRQFDPADDDGVSGYYFSERAGKDSVAFLLYDQSREGANPWGVLTQWHGPLCRFSPGAYTGSLDKEALQIEEVCQEEAMEEAGYHVGLERITYLGAQTVSGQCNEECHLFVVDVTGMQPAQIQPENEFEANCEREWWTTGRVLAQADWKAKLIALLWSQAR